MPRSIVFVFILMVSSGIYSQEKEKPGSLSTQASFSDFLPSDFQLNIDVYYEYGLEIGRYDLQKILPGLYLKAENYSFDTGVSNVQGGGYIFKYQVKNSRTYFITGPQITRLAVGKERISNFGLSAGIGHEINDNLILEARYFQNLNSESYSSDYDHLQSPVMNPLTLKIKKSF